MKYVEERLKHTLNKNLPVVSVINTYKTAYEDLLNNRKKYHPLDFATRVEGMHYLNNCIKDNYSFPIDNTIGFSDDEITQAIKCFNMKVWEKELERIATYFNANPYAETKNILNVFDSLVRYGALLIYAEKNKLYKDKNSLIKKWNTLTACQNILTLKTKTDYTDKLEMVYNNISVYIQTISFLIDETKADDRVLGFYSDLLSVLYVLQLKNDTYLIDSVREKMLRLFTQDMTGKQYEIKEGVVFPCIEKAYNTVVDIQGNGEVFLDWIKQANIKELFFHYADRIFTEKTNNFFVVLSPSHNTLQFMTEKEFNQYYAIFPKKVYLLCKLRTENPEKITNINELKAVLLKWINEIVCKLQMVFYELSSYLPDYMKSFKTYSP